VPSKCTIVRIVGRPTYALEVLYGENRDQNRDKTKTLNNRSGQCCRTASSIRKRALQTSSNPYSDLSSCLRS
jgi:hypothetical protein